MTALTLLVLPSQTFYGLFDLFVCFSVCVLRALNYVCREVGIPWLLLLLQHLPPELQADQWATCHFVVLCLFVTVLFLF